MPTCTCCPGPCFPHGPPRVLLLSVPLTLPPCGFLPHQSTCLTPSSLSTSCPAGTPSTRCVSSTPPNTSHHLLANRQTPAGRYTLGLDTPGTSKPRPLLHRHPPGTWCRLPGRPPCLPAAIPLGATRPVTANLTLPLPPGRRLSSRPGPARPLAFACAGVPPLASRALDVHVPRVHEEHHEQPGHGARVGQPGPGRAGGAVMGVGCVLRGMKSMVRDQLKWSLCGQSCGTAWTGPCTCRATKQPVAWDGGRGSTGRPGSVGA